jgi:hypothetical protein
MGVAFAVPSSPSAGLFSDPDVHAVWNVVVAAKPTAQRIRVPAREQCAHPLMEQEVICLILANDEIAIRVMRRIIIDMVHDRAPRQRFP